jgi:23S rRNA (adenine1618-N6)-methyltransferase
MSNPVSAVNEGSMHPRNKYQGRYELQELRVIYPELEQWIIQHEKAGETLQFAEPGAVTALNKALMLNVSFTRLKSIIMFTIIF